MRSALVPITSFGRRAVSSWVCAACCRQEPVIPTRSSPASLQAGIATAHSATSRRISLPRNTTFAVYACPLQPKRFLSSQSSQQSQSPSSSSGRKESQARNKIPQFYALFPETLPDGPPPSGPFHIDVPTLRREFLRLQAAAHPDFHHSAQLGESAATKTARSRAEAASALINTAFKTLSNPLLRAQYLLHELSGVDLEGDEAGSETGPPDPELLMTVMEAREVIDEAESERDLEGVAEENERRIAESEEVLGKCFAEGDWEGAKKEAVRLRYWVNIREGIKNWEGPGRGVVIHH